ncbi:histidine kinase [Actinomycetaceae bacterium L2_0104]
MSNDTESENGGLTRSPAASSTQEYPGNRMGDEASGALEASAVADSDLDRYGSSTGFGVPVGEEVVGQMRSSFPPVDPGSASSKPPSTSRLARIGRVMLQQEVIDWRLLVRSIAHLAALGVVGTLVVLAVGALTALGIVTIPLFGLGIVILVGALYIVYGAASFEIERAHALYGIDVPELTRVRGEGEGLGPFLAMAWSQVQDLRMWRSFLSMAVSALLGVGLLLIFWVATESVFLTFAFMDGRMVMTSLFGQVPALQASILGFLTLILAMPAIAGLGLLQGVVVRNLAVLPSRESLNREVQQKTVQREGAVRAADLERTRIERDLHDGVQPRLVSVAISLGMAQGKIESDPGAAKDLVREAHVSVKAAITELRQLARGIHPSVLDDRGLDAALSALAGRSHIPVSMDVRMDEREQLIENRDMASSFRDAEAAAYFAIAESLTNAAKHSRASECRVVVRLRDVESTEPVLWARVEDNGIGGGEIVPGGGLDGIRSRILAAGGTSTFVSPAGGPTALEVSVPCAF